MKLYGVVRSRATRPLWALLESGLDFEQVPVIQSYRLPDPAAADAPLNTASPAFLAVNPQGQVPALTDVDLVLTESLAITLFVGRKAGAPLGPRDLAEEAEMLNWALVGATGLEPGAIEILYTYMEGAQQTEAGAARIAGGIALLSRSAARLDAHLTQSDWLVGGRFTVADICLAEILRYAQIHGPALDPWPAIRGWLTRCQSRPAFVEVMARRTAEPA